VVKLVIEKVKGHKSPGIDQIPAELIKAGSRTICYGISKRISIMNKEELDTSRLLYLSIRRAKKQIVTVIGAYHYCQLRTKFYPTSCCQG